MFIIAEHSHTPKKISIAYDRKKMVTPQNNNLYDASGDPLDMVKLALQAKLMNPLNERPLDFYHFLCLGPLLEKADSIEKSSPDVASAINVYANAKSTLDSVINFEENIHPLESLMGMIMDDIRSTVASDEEFKMDRLDRQTLFQVIISEYLSAIKGYSKSFYSMQIHLLAKIKQLSNDMKKEPLSLIENQAYRDEIQRRAGSKNDYLDFVDTIIELINASNVYGSIVGDIISSGLVDTVPKPEKDIILPTTDKLNQFLNHVMDFEGKECKRIYGKTR
jgi:hypothetical protein